MFEIFRAGTHTDNNGRQVNISAADLAEAVAAYDPKLHEAPIVVGHPKTDDPAFGWISGLKTENGVLFADFAQVDDDFAGLVKAGRYKKVSASFYPPDSPNNPKPGVWSLRHVGFLGAQPPAVKGLAAINFAEGEVYVEFSEAAHGIAARLWRNMREWLIAQFGQDAADKVVPDWEIEGIKEMAARPDLPPDPVLFADPPPTPNPTHQNESTKSEKEQSPPRAAEKTAREKAEADAAQAKAELQKLQDEQAKDLRDAAHQQNTDFAEGLVKEGRLKPADKALVVQVLDFAEHPEHTTADFGEGEAAKPLGAALREFLAAVLPQQLPTGEMARGGEAQAAGSLNFAEYADPTELDLHQRAQALAAKEGLSYEQAVFRCMK